MAEWPEIEVGICPKCGEEEPRDPGAGSITDPDHPRDEDGVLICEECWVELDEAVHFKPVKFIPRSRLTEVEAEREARNELIQLRDGQIEDAREQIDKLEGHLRAASNALGDEEAEGRALAHDVSLAEAISVLIAQRNEFQATLEALVGDEAVQAVAERQYERRRPRGAADWNGLDRTVRYLCLSWAREDLELARKAASKGGEGAG